MTTYLLIASLIASVFSLLIFYFSTNLIYKKYNKKNINVLNTFTFEVTPKLKSKEGSITYILFLFLAFVLFGVISFVSRFVDVLPIIFLVLVVIMLFCLAFLPLLSLNKLKEHLYLNLGAIISFTTASAFLTYLSYSMCKVYDYKNVSLIIALVVSGLLFLFSLIFIFNPQLFNFRNEINEKGESVRKKYIPLAFSEWMILLSSPLLLIPLILISSVIK